MSDQPAERAAIESPDDPRDGMAVLPQEHVDRMVEEIRDLKRRLEERRHVVSFGNAFDGLRLVGPFDSHEEALEYAEGEPLWEVVELTPPGREDHKPRVYVEHGRIMEDDGDGMTIDLTDQAQRVVRALTQATSPVGLPSSLDRVRTAAQDIGNEFGWFDEPD